MKPLTLLLLRHAEAEAPQPGLADMDRRLSIRGRTEALDAADCIAAAEPRIDAMLVSPALRTRETAIIVAAELEIADVFHCEPALYLGTPDALLEPLQRCAADAQTVLMVGHNPGLSALAQKFVGSKQRIELRPAGLCRIRFEQQSWRQIRPEAAVAFSVLR
ncbi:MAG: histidine phosphatase family protein [Steroidobacteraceae bacterium]